MLRVFMGSTTPPSLRFGAPWPGVKKHRGVGRDVGLAKSGRARARLIREAKLFSEKSSQENKIFVDCSAESTKVGSKLGLASQRCGAPYYATGSAQRTPDSERRTANGMKLVVERR